jgi:hypothetical protein
MSGSKAAIKGPNFAFSSPQRFIIACWPFPVGPLSGEKADGSLHQDNNYNYIQKHSVKLAHSPLSHKAS